MRKVSRTKAPTLREHRTRTHSESEAMDKVVDLHRVPSYFIDEKSFMIDEDVPPQVVNIRRDHNYNKTAERRQQFAKGSSSAPQPYTTQSMNAGSLGASLRMSLPEESSRGQRIQGLLCATMQSQDTQDTKSLATNHTTSIASELSATHESYGNLSLLRGKYSQLSAQDSFEDAKDDDVSTQHSSFLSVQDSLDDSREDSGKDSEKDSGRDDEASEKQPGASNKDTISADPYLKDALTHLRDSCSLRSSSSFRSNITDEDIGSIRSGGDLTQGTDSDHASIRSNNSDLTKWMRSMTPVSLAEVDFLIDEEEKLKEDMGDASGYALPQEPPAEPSAGSSEATEPSSPSSPLTPKLQEGHKVIFSLTNEPDYEDQDQKITGEI